jgi:hypothetical protein
VFLGVTNFKLYDDVCSVYFIYLRGSWDDYHISCHIADTQQQQHTAEEFLACCFECGACGERVLFIGTQFSNLYTAVDTPALGRVVVCLVFVYLVFVCKYVLGHSRVSECVKNL